jgi:hypothetical protein
MPFFTVVIFFVLIIFKFAHLYFTLRFGKHLLMYARIVNRMRIYNTRFHRHLLLEYWLFEYCETNFYFFNVIPLIIFAGFLAIMLTGIVVYTRLFRDAKRLQDKHVYFCELMNCLGTFLFCLGYF